jgi:DNA-binding NtrC family response regulator
MLPASPTKDTMSGTRQGDLTTMRGAAPEITLAELTVVAVGPEGAKSLPVRRGASVVVGRAHPSDLVVVDGSLSRQHARIHVSEGGDVEVFDLGSTNGTFVGGKRVARARIAIGDTVRLGDVTVLVQSGRGGEAPAGLEGYDRFVLGVEQEIVRAKSFGRPLALLMVTLPRDAKVQANEALAKLAAELRPVDRVGHYAARRAQILAPELGAEGAGGLAERLGRVVPSARVTWATYPEDGTTLDELLDVAREGRTPRRAVAQLADSPAMQKARAEVDRIAASELPVLLLGETGVGKEVLARRVHERSARRNGPFHAVSCAAVAPALLESALFGHERGAFTGAEKTTRGVFEVAQGGTLFLDEVGELTTAAQAALLRVLETRTVARVGSERSIAVDVRVVAATHRNLDAMVERGEFRQDLLFRLEGAAVAIPPLRARTAEIEPLARVFLDEANRQNGRATTGFDAEALAAMHSYAWPGNVRELRNAVARAVVVAEGDVITLADLPERVRKAAAAAGAGGPRYDAAPGPSPTMAPASPPMTAMPAMPGRPGMPAAPGDVGPRDFREHVKNETRALETALIVEALRAHGGNQTAAAKALNLPVRTLTHKMKELGIKR